MPGGGKEEKTSGIMAGLPSFADAFLMRDEKIPLYGVGKTPQVAMDDYRSVIVEYYESLEADADHLGEILNKQLATLRKVFTMLETSPWWQRKNIWQTDDERDNYFSWRGWSLQSLY
jgi:hypothetical protein